ncbi:hypothetical protein [Streptomyces eurythermus]|uniref:hypothetical protein n=1 Tax=Streptomyces eurythermus TaxID=42237 RepID=UPI003F4D6A76
MTARRWPLPGLGLGDDHADGGAQHLGHAGCLVRRDALVVGWRSEIIEVLGTDTNAAPHDAAEPLRKAIAGFSGCAAQ